MRNISIFSGSSHPELVKAICKRLAVPVALCDISSFSNTESSIKIGESVRDADVYIVQSRFATLYKGSLFFNFCCGDVNNVFIEMLIMVAACRTASARKITV
jgi:ribose-phosphate pyrophosphokinase